MDLSEKTFTMSEIKTKDRKSKFMKYFSLISLTLQSAFVALSMRHARTRANEQDLFFSSTVIIMTELTKLIACLVIVFFEEDRNVMKFGAALHKTIIKNKMDTLKICLPAFLFVLQNNLQYFGASHLDAATYQVCCQFTIVASAFFTIIILRRKLLLTQWGALYFLITGISIIQLTDPKKISTTNTFEQNRLLGFIAVISSCVCSGLGGVILEKMLKRPDISVFMRNVQMSLASVPIATITCLAGDFNNISTKGFFHGYDWFIVYLILFNAFGGVLVGLAMRYADSILKGFATSSSIIISCIVSVFLFDFVLTAQFMIGVMIVIGSVYLYGYKPSETQAESSGKNAKLKHIVNEAGKKSPQNQEIGSDVYVIQV